MKVTRLFFAANVLLYLIVGATAAQAANIAAPRPIDCKALTSADSKDVVLAIGRESMSWNGSPVYNMDELSSRALVADPNEPQSDIRLCADAHSKFASIALTLQTLQRAGVTDVNFVTDGKPKLLNVAVTLKSNFESRPVVMIDIDGDGKIYWNGTLVPDAATLERNFQRMVKEADQSELQVRPNKSVEYKSVASVLASAGKFRVKTIRLVSNEMYVQATTNSPPQLRAYSPPAANAEFLDLNACLPQYPRASLIAEEQGTVRIQFTISAEGKLMSAVLVKSSGFPNLDNAAFNGLSNCKFKPAVMGDKPVQSSFTADWVWKLDP